MAKTKTTHARPAAEPPSLAEGIREAFGELGHGADKASVAGWLRQRYPGYSFKESTLGSTLSTVRKQQRGGNGPGGGQQRGEPTLSELLRVKSLAEARGGIEALLAQVQEITDLAEQAGGLDRLRACLEALRSIHRPAAAP